MELFTTCWSPPPGALFHLFAYFSTNIHLIQTIHGYLDPAHSRHSDDMWFVPFTPLFNALNPFTVVSRANVPVPLYYIQFSSNLCVHSIILLSPTGAFQCCIARYTFVSFWIHYSPSTLCPCCSAFPPFRLFLHQYSLDPIDTWIFRFS